MNRTNNYTIQKRNDCFQTRKNFSFPTFNYAIINNPNDKHYDKRYKVLQQILEAKKRTILIDKK